MLAQAIGDKILQYYFRVNKNDVPDKELLFFQLSMAVIRILVTLNHT
jgi:hypothetical protein